MRPLTVSLGLALAVTLAACSSSTGGSGHQTSSPPSGALTAAQAKGALIGPTDVGAGFTAQPTNTPSSRFPCTPNDPPLDKQFPPAFDVRAAFLNNPLQAEVTEQIEGYSDAATTASALAAGEKGLACSSGTIKSGSGSQTVQLNGPTDLTSQLKAKVDKSEEWQLQAQGAVEIIIVNRVGPQLVVLEFTAATGADQSKLPSAQTITETALRKVLAAS